MASTHPFKDKVIAVTGAASGIGLATAHYLAQRGASLSLADVQLKNLDDAVDSIKKASPGVQLLATVVDVRNSSDVETWITSTVTKLGKLDGAANVAGVFVELPNGLRGLDDKVWEFVMGVNMTGVMNCLRAQLKYPIYTTSKHGVIGLTKCAARKMGDMEVRVNCLVAGRIEKPMMAHAATISTAQFPSERFIKRSELPEDVAPLIAYLGGDESRFITGSVNQVDGGRLC